LQSLLALLGQRQRLTATVVAYAQPLDKAAGLERREELRDSRW
jgi:hypothetical protein